MVQIDLTNDQQEQWIETNLQNYVKQKRDSITPNGVNDQTIANLQSLRLETAYLTLQSQQNPDKVQNYLQDYNSLAGIVKYNLQNGHYYSLTKSTTWTEAQVEAQRLGGNLITINNADEQQWILNTFGTTGNYWIGLKKNLSNGT
ncbi:lectin-like protein, partial [Microcystis aeruginosa]|uniref:lectin-like protein n=1 Tax=Microcystis aeruginosa TaxID=1126 RepID=UPI00264A2570